jgi:DnaJ-class molecular chaperone
MDQSKFDCARCYGTGSLECDYCNGRGTID